MTVNDSLYLDSIFEDLHWTILIAGHTLCMESEGETALIPSEIMQHSMKLCSKTGKADLESTLKVMASVQQHGVNVEGAEKCDDVIQIFSDVLKLCSVEILAAEVKLGHFMSPEVTCSVMWFLKRFCLSYLLPNEILYQEISPILIGSLGKDTEGATFIINFVLAKIQSNICHFHSEPVLLQDTVGLFTDVVCVKQK